MSLYIYISEDSTMTYANTPPTAVDNAMAANDITTILKFSDGRIFEMTQNNNWVEMSKALLQEGCEGQGQYHG
jgi:hypothetical protein